MALSPSWTVNGLSLTTFPFSVPFDGPDYGTPDVTVDTLISFLTRGDLEHTSHTGNRTLTLPVDIEGSSLLALAQAEALLKAAVDVEFGELVIDPGDGVAPPFKFNIFRGVMAFQRLDAWEMAGMRRFVLTFRAEPDVYSTTLTTVAAPATSGSNNTTVDTMSAVTGWTGAVDGAAVTPTSSGGALTVASTAAVSAGTHTLTATRAGSIATSSTKWLVLDWKIDGAVGFVTATGNGTPLTLTATQASPTPGYTRSWFYVAASSVTTLAFSFLTNASNSRVRSVTLDNLDRTDIRPTVGTVRQQLRTLAIGGSAPTIGSLAVEHATTPLGDVFVHTSPDDGSGYVPACRNYHVAGAVSTDATTCSGAYDTITTSNAVYQVPTTSLPHGEYLAVARLRLGSGAAQPATITLDSSTILNGVVLDNMATKTRTVTLSTAYSFVPLGMTTLPRLSAAPNGAGTTSMIVAAVTAGGVTVRLDELYLFNLSSGRLSQFACGTGTAGVGGPANRLWIDSPSINNDGLGDYQMGFSADRSDSYSAYPAAANGTVGIHQFPGGQSLKVFTVTTNPTTSADVSFTYYAAWSNHAAT